MLQKRSLGNCGVNLKYLCFELIYGGSEWDAVQCELIDVEERKTCCLNSLQALQELILVNQYT